MSNIIKPRRSGGVIGTIGPIRGSGVFSLQERYALTADNYENVSLYLKMNGANGSTTFYDSSLYGHTVTANGNAQVSTAQSKFGGASGAFDGSGDYLSVPASSNFAFDADFTVETWIKTSVFSEDIFFRRVLATGPDGNSSINLLFRDASGASPNVSVYSNAFLITGTISAATGDWVHVALCRSGSLMRLFVNGTQSGSTASTSTNFSAGATYGLTVGRYPTGNGHFDGYIDDLRITKGVARYTGNFTPPQREFRP